jgi:hypothetical protein
MNLLEVGDDIAVEVFGLEDLKGENPFTRTHNPTLALLPSSMYQAP